MFRAVFVLVLTWSSSSFAETDPIAHYIAFREDGCKKAQLSTPIEARILRSAAHALHGKKFSNRSLRRLFSAIPDYSPKSIDVTLPDGDWQCVLKILRVESKMRMKARLPRHLENRITSLEVHREFRYIYYRAFGVRK